MPMPAFAPVFRLFEAAAPGGDGGAAVAVAEMGEDDDEEEGDVASSNNSGALTWNVFVARIGTIDRLLVQVPAALPEGERGVVDDVGLWVASFLDSERRGRR
ncbi:MAG: hypothetical protein Q9169_008606 [Polycauliona sp. 2 TL-2023]